MQLHPTSDAALSRPDHIVFLGEKAGRERCGDISHATWWRWVANDPTFPKRRRVGRRVFWAADELDEWMRSREVVS